MKKTLTMEGAYTALVTPFDEQGSVDYSGLERNIEVQIQEGIDGIVLLGTTGEAPTISEEEQESIIRFSLQVAKERIPVFIGTGSYCTAKTICLTREAQELGADGALIVTPYYNKPTQEGLFRHFMALAEAVPDFPIIIYNIQGRTGQNLQTSTLQRLFDVPSLVAVKEASGNINQMADVIECAAKYRPDLKILSGDDNMTFPLMALGGHGVISVVSNLVPGWVKQLVHKMQQGDIDGARQLHYYLLPLFKGAFIETNPIPIKAAMNMRGLAAGPCRLPLCDLSPENKEALKHIVEAYEHETIVAT